MMYFLNGWASDTAAIYFLNLGYKVALHPEKNLFIIHQAMKLAVHNSLF
jgi:hypothetical protein